ncbi:terpene synthase family protein [Chitinophaga solisilvae]|uniref:terpene synthase family protein n=1 Tax=Chitinophaga solisilvae TaxID=1233460 RepID=UPI00136AB415|nr:terpene synthase family protein [Chitinophaga solisilvae]
MQTTKTAAAAGIARLRKSYSGLLASGKKLSLLNLLDGPHPSIADYCRSYHPNAANDQLTSAVKNWSHSYGIWLQSGEHYLTCATYLFPAADYQRGVYVVKNCAVDYYLNETIGRDVFRKLSPARQQEAARMIRRMASLSDNFQLPALPLPVESANYEMLCEIRDTSPDAWFREFLKMYSYHIGITHRDTTSGGLQKVLNVNEYINLRLHTSGMPHILLLIEYATGRFLDWKWLERQGMKADMEQLQRDTALFGALSNDLFSFEKEVIDCHTDTNLVAVYALNNPELPLPAVIRQVAAIVNKCLSGYFETVSRMENRLRMLETTHAPEVEDMNVCLHGIRQCVQASWIWQVYTRRYKRMDSIFRETTLQEA